MDELKPCPFCGGKVQMANNIDFEPEGVYCPTCHMKVRYTRIAMKNKDTFGDVMERTATAWNRRAIYRSY